MNFVEAAARKAFAPADRRPPWQWCEDNFTVAVSPFPGKWRSENSPWVKEFMEVFADNEVQTVAVMCSAQSAKTETVIALLAWVIANDPGQTMWVTSNEDEAMKFCTERLMPSLMKCEPVASQLPRTPTGIIDRRLVKGTEIFFPRMILEVIGSNAEAKLQSKPRRWLFMDEVRNWPPGALPMVLKRTRAFWNARRVIISTPDMQHDAVHQEFLQGDQRHFHVLCPHCNMHQPFEWSGMRYDENDETRPMGIWNFDKLAKTIRWECPVCKGEITDQPQNRRHIAKNGKWIPRNPSAPKHRVSFHWNAMLPPWVRWRDLVEEFINAAKALAWGDPEPLKTFINESLGEPWEDRMRYSADDDEKKLLERCEDYHLGSRPADEKIRFAAVDVQKDHLRFVCRAFGVGGQSWLIDYGKLANFGSLREKLIELKVDDANVVIDAAHRTAEVYREVLASKYQWKAFWGDDSRYFNIAGLRTIFNVSRVDPAIGTPLAGRVMPIALYHWSNPSAKDMLQMLMRGMTAPWRIPRRIPQDYIDQLTAERREEYVDAKGQVTFKWTRIRRDNHYFDCEAMLVVAAVITRWIGLPEARLETAPPVPPHEIVLEP